MVGGAILVLSNLLALLKYSFSKHCSCSPALFNWIRNNFYCLSFNFQNVDSEYTEEGIY